MSNGILYSFGLFLLSPEQMVLSVDGSVVPVPLKALKTLLTLIEHGGEVVSKQVLIEAVWPDSYVEEGNLTQNRKIRQPYCFEVGEGELFAFAGLCDAWKNPKGETIESCTILTTTSNELVANIHARMPVIVPPEKYNLWLLVRNQQRRPRLSEKRGLAILGAVRRDEPRAYDKPLTIPQIQASHLN